ncbi:MAG: diguanylate cyclase [Mycobacteriales bacterium]|jgi:diguanylate cyclase (GGDEF)-like protein
MGHPPADVCVADRLGVAARRARESRVDDVRAEVEAARAAAGGALGRDDAVLAGVLVATACSNAGLPEEASRELAAVQPLLPDTQPLRQARYHAIAGTVAHSLGDEERAIAELIWALALVDENQPATEELARVLGNCSGVLAQTQLFTLGVEAGERAVQAAIACGLQAALFQFRAGAANLAWAIRLEHLRLPADARKKWLAAAEQLESSLTWGDKLTAVCIARTHGYLGLTAARLGEPTEARRQLAIVRGIEITDAGELAEVGPLMTHLEGATLLAEGRADAATLMLAPSWPEVRDQHKPPWTEDVAFLLARAAETTGNNRDALRWYGEVHKRYGQAEYEVALARAAAARLRVDKEALVRRSRQLESDSRSDPLTGVANRRALDEELRQRVPGAGAGLATPTTLVVVDIDHFKRINDECGHLTGDEVLRRVARLLRQQVRDGDLCARFGGDEFVLVLTATLAEAGEVTGRLAEAVAGHEWAAVAPGLSVTVTCGLAQSTVEHTPATLFAAADADLLAAKRARQRNRTPATAAG